MDRTSPEHDALIRLAEQYARAGHTAAYDAMRAALRATDAERYDTETASPTCTFVLDRWDGCGWIVDTYPTGRAAEIRANELNSRNIRDGQQQVRKVAEAARSERSA